MNTLLSNLSDGQSHRLDSLMSVCDLYSIQALQERLQRLADAGLDIELDQHEVCWNQPVPLLNVDKINQALPLSSPFTAESFDLHFETASTNQMLTENFIHQRICLAEMQSSGRGRRGNHWISPPCQNIYLSIAWEFDCSLEQLSGLSLLMGIAIAALLRPHLSTRIGVKWPNDIYLEGKKCGGVLVETIAMSTQRTRVVMGLGLNVHMQQPFDGLDQPWTSIGQYMEAVDRNHLVAMIVSELAEMLSLSPDLMSDYIQSNWPEYDLALNEPVVVMAESEIIQGMGNGIDLSYRFLLRTVAETRAFSRADVSLRLR